MSVADWDGVTPSDEIAAAVVDLPFCRAVEHMDNLAAVRDKIAATLRQAQREYNVAHDVMMVEARRLVADVDRPLPVGRRIPDLINAARRRIGGGS